MNTGSVGNATIETWQTTTHSPDETRALGRQLGKILRPGDIVALQGNLGAGKTVLVQGIAQGLGITHAITSPTFILVNEYDIPQQQSTLYHMDAYRLEDAPAEALEIGLSDMTDGRGIVVIEWAGRIQSLLPADTLFIDLSAISDQQRQIRLHAAGARGQQMIAALHPLEQATA